VCHRDTSAGARQLKLTRLTDFGLWFGKSIFESTLAEVVQKEHLGHTAVTLVVCEITCSRIRSLRLTFYKDVLELVVAVYRPDVTGVCKERTGPQQTYEDFYRSIHDRRCDTSDTEWDSFRQQLSSNIATSCERLRNEKAPELHRISLSTPYSASMASAPTSDAGSRASSSSSSSSTSSLVSSHQQHSAESPSTINETGQHQSTSQSQASQPQALQPLTNHAPAPQTAVDMHRYTSVLNEHAALQGEKLTYKKKQLSISPSSWQCTATFGEISGVGIGRNTTQAKHAASKEICELIDLLVV